MKTKIIMPAKLLTGMLLSMTLAIPMVVEAGRGHHHHDHRHHHYYNAGPGYGGYGYGRPHYGKHKHRHIQHHHHYNHSQHIYYNQPYYPPVAPAYGAGYYGVAPGNFFLGINTGGTRFMLGY
jgi:hypothetical protein